MSDLNRPLSRELLLEIKTAAEDSMLDDFVTTRQNGQEKFDKLMTPQLVLRWVTMTDRLLEALQNQPNLPQDENAKGVENSVPRNELFSGPSSHR